MTTVSKFAFLDENEAMRRLGVDRDTLLTFVRERRLRAFSGVGKGNFFRTGDVDTLQREISREASAPSAGTSDGGSGRKVFDPVYKVHVRLQADLKWYDLEDEDLVAWARAMTPDGYARQRTNIQRVIEKLQRMIELMDAQAADWKTLAPPKQTDAHMPRRTGRSLPMAGGGQTPAESAR